MSQKKIILNVLLIGLCMFVTLGFPKHLQSQDKYPTRGIDIVVPWAPGGSTDLTSRVMADYLKKKWRVPVNIVNKTGGGGVPACLEVYKAKPDGYTILADSGTSNSTMEVFIKDLPFKVMDRTFIGAHSDVPFIFAVPTASPFQSLKDLADDAKKDPGHFTWGTGGNMGFQVTAMRQFFKEIGIDISKTREVVSTGGSQVIVLVAGGHIKVGGGSPSSCLPAFQAGTIRLLAATSKERFPGFPNTPTTAEQGYPGINAHQWNGVSGPPKLPLYIVEIWEKALQEMVKDPEVISRMRAVASVTMYQNSRELRSFVERDTQEIKMLWGVK